MDSGQREASQITTKRLGDAAESVALAHLVKAGLKRVETNYRTPGRGGGEIDLIMRESDGTLVFIEVRQRSGASHGGAAASIGAAITVTLYKLWRRNQVPVMTAPEYAAPLPAAVHRLGFESEPSGATVVTEDGDRWGITPFTRTLPPGSARTRVIFKLDGHDDASLDVQAGASAMHKVLLRPRIPVLAPVPADVTTAGPLGDATAGAGETPVEAPGKGVTAVKTRPSKTRPPSSSKDPVPETAPEPIAPAADAKAEEELDMGELKNPFRNKK